MAPTPEIVGKLASYFGGDDDVIAAFLFGSFAHNRQRPGSDVDIAVLLDEPAGRLNRKELLGRLHGELGRLLRKDIHILILNEASLLARLEALFKGHCLHVKDEYRLQQFRMLTLSQFSDFAPYFDQLHRRFVERLGVHCDGQ